VALTTDELNAVVAQWEEWTADAGFRLEIRVRSDDRPPVFLEGQQRLGARVAGSLFCQVTIYRRDVLVFDERVPYDAGMLRASVTTLARYIASQPELPERGEI